MKINLSPCQHFATMAVNPIMIIFKLRFFSQGCTIIWAGISFLFVCFSCTENKGMGSNPSWSPLIVLLSGQVLIFIWSWGFYYPMSSWICHLYIFWEPQCQDRAFLGKPHLLNQSLRRTGHRPAGHQQAKYGSFRNKATLFPILSPS